MNLPHANSNLSDLAWGSFPHGVDFNPESKSILYLSFGEKSEVLGCYAGVTIRGLNRRISEHLNQHDYSFELKASLAWELPKSWSTANASGQVSLAEGLLIHTLVRSLEGKWLENRQYPSKVSNLSEDEVDSVVDYMEHQVYPQIESHIGFKLDREPRPVAKISRGRNIHAFHGGSLVSGDAMSTARRNLWRPTDQPRQGRSARAKERAALFEALNTNPIWRKQQKNLGEDWTPSKAVRRALQSGAGIYYPLGRLKKLKKSNLLLIDQLAETLAMIDPRLRLNRIYPISKDANSPQLHKIVTYKKSAQSLIRKGIPKGESILVSIEASALS